MNKTFQKKEHITFQSRFPGVPIYKVTATVLNQTTKLKPNSRKGDNTFKQGGNWRQIHCFDLQLVLFILFYCFQPSTVVQNQL